MRDKSWFEQMWRHQDRPGVLHFWVAWIRFQNLNFNFKWLEIVVEFFDTILKFEVLKDRNFWRGTEPSGQFIPTGESDAIVVDIALDVIQQCHILPVAEWSLPLLGIQLHRLAHSF